MPKTLCIEGKATNVIYLCGDGAHIHSLTVFEIRVQDRYFAKHGSPNHDPA